MERDVSRTQTERARGTAERAVLGKTTGATALRFVGFAVLLLVLGLLFVWLS